MGVKGATGKALFEERRVRRNFALVLIFVAVRGGEVGAVHGAVNRDFALRATADRADFFTLCRAKAFFFSFFTNWTRQKRSPWPSKQVGRILCACENAK